jgi:glutathione S-transferase
MGLLESVVAWLRVYRKPELQQPAGIIMRETTRANRSADALEASVASGAYSGQMNAAQIVLGVALALIEPRLPMWKWREGRHRLSAWFNTIAARPSFEATAVPSP